MRMPGRIRIHEEFCIGCRLCEIVCIVRHSKSGTLLKTFQREDPRPLPRVRVEEEGYISFALQCRHCDKAPCVENCITGALYRDEVMQAVLCDQDRCVGCWMCVLSCPFGVIQREFQERKVISKCDLCGGEDMPVCVAHCPNEALTYE